MLIEQLLSGLREQLKSRIRNGELTERGLARRTGVSQAHVHNVLKGARILTPEVADQILRVLGMSIYDLLPGTGHEPAANSGVPRRKDPARATGLRRGRRQPGLRATSR